MAEAWTILPDFLNLNQPLVSDNSSEEIRIPTKACGKTGDTLNAETEGLSFEFD